jgi:Ca-activated chloride channel family protein
MIDRWANPAAFYWLWLLPILVVISGSMAKTQARRFKKAIDSRLLPLLTQSVSNRKRKVRLFLQLLVLLTFVLALGRPQAGQKREKVKSEGIEIMLVVDVSQSMLAEDVKPSRLDLTKRELSRFVDMSTGDRIGLIAFAGSAMVLSPLTTDRNALKMYIDSLSPNSVSTQGTEFRKALAEADDAFSRGGVEGGETAVTTRAIAIVSDGEDHEPGAEEAARHLVEKGIRIFTIGVGTEKGGPIPLRDEHGVMLSYLKDEKGQVVLTQTRSTVLKVLAEAGHGSFRQLTFGGDAIDQLHKDIDQLQKTAFDSAELTSYSERYQFFLIAAIGLALMDVAWSERRRKSSIWRGRFEVIR